MAKTVDLRTYLLLERAFVRRLQRSWRMLSAPTYALITQACLDHKWDEARRLVPELDMTEVGTENREWITYMLLSCAVFGAGTVRKGKPSFVGVGTFDTFLKQVTNNILTYLELSATAQVQEEALQSIAEDEAKTKALKFDPSQPRDENGRWRIQAGLGAGEYTAGKNRQVDTPEFKAWFKDSKIVDEQGRPFVAFHGTPSRGGESNNRWVQLEQTDVKYSLIEEFDTAAQGVTDSGWLGTGTYFTPDPDYAHEFGDRIMPVFLSIQKPFVVEDDGSNSYANSLRFLKSLQGMEGLPEDLKLDLSHPKPSTYDYAGNEHTVVYETVNGIDVDGTPKVLLLSRSSDAPPGTGAVESKGATAEEAIFAHRYKDVHNTFLLGTITKQIGARKFREMLIKAGHDGVIERRPEETTPKEIVAFYPEQIKSALGNRGTFDPRNPSILKWDESKHPRDKEGQFAVSRGVGFTEEEKAILRRGGPDIEGSGPERAKWVKLNEEAMEAFDVFMKVKTAHRANVNKATDKLEAYSKTHPDASVEEIEAEIWSDPEYLRTKKIAQAAEKAKNEADARLRYQEPEMMKEIVRNVAYGVAVDMGVDPYIISVVHKDPREFVVGNKQFREAGHYTPADRLIEVNAKNVGYADTPTLKGIVAHEVSHFIYHRLKDEVEREVERYKMQSDYYGHDKKNAWFHERFIQPHEYGPVTVRPEWQAWMEKEFPASAVWSKLAGGEVFTGISDEMKAENGHSAYAKSYWAKEAVMKVGTYDKAINETVAEDTRYLLHEKNKGKGGAGWHEPSKPSSDSQWLAFTKAMHTWYQEGSEWRRAGIERIRAEYAKRKAL